MPTARATAAPPALAAAMLDDRCCPLFAHIFQWDPDRRPTADVLVYRLEKLARLAAPPMEDPDGA